MPATDPDPFDRAVAREALLRRGAMSLSTREGVMRLALLWMIAVGVAWAAALAAHWWLLPEPRWLVVAHTVAFTLVTGYYLLVLAFLSRLRHGRPELFSEV